MAKNNFPSFNEYQAVLQSPSICFTTPELKNSSVETDLWGLPRVWSGGFALTYKLTSRIQPLAVRCFHRFVPDRTLRYTAISTFLTSNRSDIFIPIRYLIKGVLVRGGWYPITYMEWVQGDTLEAYLVKNYKDSVLMQGLISEFLRVVGEMESLGIAHGDLSHRNIMVRDGKIVLVDYDGMYVPALQGHKSTEIGNIHSTAEPHRTPLNANIDRFSSIVIYLALQALSVNPSLLDRYETGGEGVLFQREDFLNPYQSTLLREMETLPDLKNQVNQFRQICTSEPDMVPRLMDFIAGRPLDVPRNEIPIQLTPQTPNINAIFRSRLLTQVGKWVTVVGRVSEIFRGISRDDSPHVFLNMGSWRLKSFTIVVWDGALQLFDASGKSLDDYQGQWVSVTGMMTAFEQRPQIMINSPTDIQLLADEKEAQRLLGIYFIPSTTSTVLPAAGIAKKPQDIVSAPVISTPSSLQSVKGSLDQTREVLARLEKLFPTTQDPDRQTNEQ